MLSHPAFPFVPCCRHLPALLRRAALSGEAAPCGSHGFPQLGHIRYLLLGDCFQHFSLAHAAVGKFLSIFFPFSIVSLEENCVVRYDTLLPEREFLKFS